MLIKLRDDLSIAPFHTSAKSQQYIIGLPDGKRLQVSSKVLDVILSVRDHQYIERVSEDLSRKWNTTVTTHDIKIIIDNFLIPHKLILEEDQLEERTVKSREKSPRGPLFFKVTLLPQEFLSKITAKTSYLYSKVVWPPVLMLIIFFHVATYVSIFNNYDIRTLAVLPGYRYALAYFLIIVCVLWHEIGHASALRYFGASHGAIGFGLYLVFPIMYSDVSDAWRLRAGQRAVVDVGGIYLQAMTSLLFYPAYLLTGDPLCLGLVTFNDALIIMSLNPLLKFDGYWLFSDLVGVPNLRRRSLKYLILNIKLLFKRVLPDGFIKAAVPDHLRLRPITATMLLLYGVASLAFLCFASWIMARFAPDIVANYAVLLRDSFAEIRDEVALGNAHNIVNIALKIFFQTMPVLGIALMLWSLIKLPVRLLKKHGYFPIRMKPHELPDKVLSR
jgi:putative peptide zinc metalloprotease protein